MQEMAEKCLEVQKYHLLVDTNLMPKASAISKILAAFAAHDFLQAFRKINGRLPSISVYGGPPLIFLKYTPGLEILQGLGYKFQISDNRATAENWLAHN